ncbi:MAG TPA: 2-hydroxyacid dehydrogenase [Candidatus Scatavimonas merdigallinarum]|uniref:2-hydroxyacid dehydrogenase n=1 Tax=Candidatus Scatavimonas merdigallinarum TaxID=2840914 RepID=A0A9D1CVQ6_9FIRM|nr:2-hydroxyacid dehydrogenase [Candidatus Scatavimonas merdigallinarum]
MEKVAFFDTKPYDKLWFERVEHPGLEFKYYENKLNEDTAGLVRGCTGAVAFVNDTIDARAIEQLCENGVQVLAMRCAGYNNIDFKAAYKKMNILRVPKYSPYAVAEHTMALILTLNRKIHRAYNRTRDYNFSLNGLTGFDLYGKTAGVIGTGKIGQAFIDICKGFGMQVIAYDPYPVKDADICYVELDELFRRSDVISLHCPLTESTHYIINSESLQKMKNGVFLVNTSRGSLIESEALLKALKEGKIGAAGLDVYEEESNLFFEDFSGSVIQDDVLSLLVSMPNVVVTSHQAFLTNEALKNIAETTISNLLAFYKGDPLENEICYHCRTGGVSSDCPRREKGRCF